VKNGNMDYCVKNHATALEVTRRDVTVKAEVVFVNLDGAEINATVERQRTLVIFRIPTAMVTSVFAKMANISMVSLALVIKNKIREIIFIIC
jgi:hypothetical protein